GAVRALRRMLETNGDVTRKLRAIWALYAIGGLDEATLRTLLGHESEYVRGWAIRLECDLGAPADETLKVFARMAREDQSAWVRLDLASALQVLPPDRRWPIAEALAARGEDADDPSLPPM